MMPFPQHTCEALQGDCQTLQSESAAVGRARMGIDAHNNKPPYKAALAMMQLVSEV